MTAALPRLNCDGCRTCCLGDTIVLLPGDNPAAYKTVAGKNGTRELAKGKDGNCVYLGKSGCQIHGRAPRACRNLDCRSYYLKLEHRPRDLGARLAVPQIAATLAEGRRRVEALRRQGESI